MVEKLCWISFWRRQVVAGLFLKAKAQRNLQENAAGIGNNLFPAAFFCVRNIQPITLLLLFSSRLYSQSKNQYPTYSIRPPYGAE